MQGNKLTIAQSRLAHRLFILFTTVPDSLLYVVDRPQQ
uniref:Uncharacterized protein n=1 Tax=Anguilla anguilla TaxID=7936 RepID=A0A0E9TFX4_ANGAN